MKRTTMTCMVSLVSSFALSPAAMADKLTFSDPRGDDNGPGEYIYPTDGVYTSGSFDLAELTVEAKGKNVEFDVEMNGRLEDPWGMGTGFAIQMIFVFINTGDGGHTTGIPGLNIEFADGHAWNKVVILSPQQQSRVTSEIRSKAADLAVDILVPRRTMGRGKSISGKVKLEDLGGGDPATWGYQVVVQSNEGFPAKTDLLTRRVNEYEGQHRFGGGNDGNCDPHVMDLLAGNADGSDDEVAAQYEMLSYECTEEGEAVRMAKLTTIKK